MQTSRSFRRITTRVQVELRYAFGRRRETATTLGAGGLFVATRDPLPKDTRISLRFQVQAGGALHELEARVVWVKRPGDPGDYSPGMGVQFTNPAAQQQLARELEQL